jgi:hypothetical protein
VDADELGRVAQLDAREPVRLEQLAGRIEIGLGGVVAEGPLVEVEEFGLVGAGQRVDLRQLGAHALILPPAQRRRRRHFGPTHRVDQGIDDDIGRDHVSLTTADRRRDHARACMR